MNEFRYYGVTENNCHVWARHRYWTISEISRFQWVKIEDVIFIIPGERDDHYFYKCCNFD